MRKYLTLLFFISTIFISFSQTDNFSKWSVSLEGGFNRFDGDVSQTAQQVFPTSFTEITYGGTIEYALSPVWGLALDLYHFPLSATSNIADFTTDLYTSSLSVTINFTRLITPETKSKFGVYGTVGLGFASYKTKTAAYQPSDKLEAAYAGTLPFTLSLEYNISRPLAIFGKLHYRPFNKDNLDGIPYKGVTNDAIAAAALGFRVKFRSVSRKHLRNITVEEFTPNQEMLKALENARKINKLDSTITKVAAKVDGIENRVDTLELTMSNEGPDSDNDGVPDQRDLSPDTPANTAVDFWGRPLQINIYNKAADSNTTNIVNNFYGETPSVYFGFDQITLTDGALITISKVAKQMTENPKLRLEVRGYCDYIGGNPYNKVLSQRRADRVKDELVKVWGISPNRIIANGSGRLLLPTTKYAPSRRCDFFFDR